MRWILYILIFLALLVLAGFLFPRVVTTERSVYIAEPPAVVFPYVNDLRKFNQWSPWFQIDPETQYSYDGFAEGVGSSMKWKSDDPNVGAGAMAITASEPYSRVAMDLDFGSQGTARSEFQLQPQGSGTNITWSFSSEMGAGPIARWIGLMVSRMVGASYEQGLQKLKTVVEDAPGSAPLSSENSATSSDSQPLPQAPESADPGTIEPAPVDPGMESPILDDEEAGELPGNDEDALEEFDSEPNPESHRE
ncbi:SRPBCC family protein [Microbulbifer sp.]|uniref:SRPBCC family protein n=1 Tax=Microbulbifer sp. TaxID=1908541 RepID=UPI0025826A04|nr:SRPBCC family protein [Microbulbifer sp.]